MRGVKENLCENVPSKAMLKKSGSKENFLDVTRLIRSIQRAEGITDCFRRAKDCYDQIACEWRPYCLEQSQYLPYEREQDS